MEVISSRNFACKSKWSLSRLLSDVMCHIGNQDKPYSNGWKYLNQIWYVDLMYTMCEDYT